MRQGMTRGKKRNGKSSGRKSLLVSTGYDETYSTRIRTMTMTPDRDPTLIAGSLTAEVMLGRSSKPGPPPSLLPPEDALEGDESRWAERPVVREAALGDLSMMEPSSDSGDGAGGLVPLSKATPRRAAPFSIGLSAGVSVVAVRRCSWPCCKPSRQFTHRVVIAIISDFR
jgi:hypothetical protein